MRGILVQGLNEGFNLTIQSLTSLSPIFSLLLDSGVEPLPQSPYYRISGRAEAGNSTRMRTLCEPMKELEGLDDPNLCKNQRTQEKWQDLFSLTKAPNSLVSLGFFFLLKHNKGSSVLCILCCLISFSSLSQTESKLKAIVD